MIAKHLANAILIAALSACAAPATLQYAIDTPAVAARKSARTTVEVREVSLPLYAAGQEIPVAGAAGDIRTDGSRIWADAPSRAISLALAESLSKMTGAMAAVEPWPLDDPAQARLDVRVRTLLASTGGDLRFSGQYFLVFDAGRRPVSRWFDLAVPLAGQGGRDIAAATGAAINDLAAKIADDLR